jgi:hypothetical protein
MKTKAKLSQLSNAESVKKWCVEILSNCSSRIIEQIASNITDEDVDCEVLSLLCEDGEKEFTNVIFGSKASKKNGKLLPCDSHAQDLLDLLAPSTLFRKVHRLKLGGNFSFDVEGLQWVSYRKM